LRLVFLPLSIALQMDPRRRIQDLLVAFRSELHDSAAALQGADHWDLSLPVAVIDARAANPCLIRSSIGTINSILKVSLTIASPALQPFFARLSNSSFEEAFEQFASDPFTGSQFVQAFEAYRHERAEKGQAMWSLEDSTAFVIKSRDCFHDQELPLVALFPGDGEEGASLFTFGVPLAFFCEMESEP